MNIFYFIVFIIMIGAFYHFLPRVFSLIVIALGFRSMYLSFYGIPEEMKTALTPDAQGFLEIIIDQGWLLAVLGFVMLLFKLNFGRNKNKSQNSRRDMTC